MPGHPFSSILRSVNRTDSNYRILLLNENEKFQNLLAQTGYDFMVANSKNAPPWNKMISEIPSNCALLGGNDPAGNLQIDMGIDLIICQSRFNLYNDGTLGVLARNISAPIICAEYDFSDPGINPDFKLMVCGYPFNISVFPSNRLANSWSHDKSMDRVRIVPLGVDTELFSGWVGDKGNILTMVDFYPQLGNFTGFDMWRKIAAQKLPVAPLGFSPGFSSKPPMKDKIAAYRSAGVFLNTSSWKSIPIELLEAMSVGCPIVTTNTADLPEIIKHDENALVGKDENELRDMCLLLLKDKDRARQLGVNARETILQNYKLEKFVDGWKDIITSTVGKTTAAITGV